MREVLIHFIVTVTENGNIRAVDKMSRALSPVRVFNNVFFCAVPSVVQGARPRSPPSPFKNYISQNFTVFIYFLLKIYLRPADWPASSAQTPRDLVLSDKPMSCRVEHPIDPPPI